MKQYIIPALLVTLISIFASCKSDSTKEREDSQLQFSSILNKIQVADTLVSESGLVLIHQKEGKGASIQSGDYIRVRYELFLADRLNIDTLTNISGLLSNLENIKATYDNIYNFNPYGFNVYGAYYSSYNAVPGNFDGVHEAALSMKEGGKAILILPYDLAQGANGSDSIPDYANIVLKLQITDIDQ